MNPQYYILVRPLLRPTVPKSLENVQRYSSMAQCLPGKYVILSSIPSAKNKQSNNTTSVSEVGPHNLYFRSLPRL